MKKQLLLVSFLAISYLGLSQTTAIPDSNFENYLETHNAAGGVVAVGDAASMGDGTNGNGLVTTSKISSVTNLNVSGKTISNLTGIEDFTALVVLNCQNNSLTSLNVSKNLFLEQIRCFNNQITSLDTSNNVYLKIFRCFSNQLTSLDVTKNIALTGLFCHNNQIKYLDLSKNTALNKLNCSTNLLTTLNAKNGNNTVITAAGDFVINNNASLVCVQVDDATHSTTNWTTKNAGTSYNTNCSYVAQTYVPDNNFETYLETHNSAGGVVAVGDAASMGNGVAGDDYVITSRITGVTTLDVSSETISSLLGIEKFTALTSLNVSTNSLSVLDVSSNTSLTSLNCANNSIKELDISANTVLTELLCNNNQLTFLNAKNTNNANISTANFNASNNANLTCIQVDAVAYSNTNWTSKDPASSFSEDCNYSTLVPDDNFENFLEANGMGNGTIDNFVLTSNINTITNLNVGGKSIADLTGIQNFLALETFDFSSNPLLTTIDLTKNTALESLTCGITGITTLDVTKNTALIYINIVNSSLTTVDLSKNVALTTIIANSNSNLTSLDLSKNIALTYIDCSNSSSLTSLNIRNGENGTINTPQFISTNTPNLTCITVDEIPYSDTTWTNIDAANSFSENCDAIVWNGSVDSNLLNNLNWDGNVLPEDDDVIITSVGTSPIITGDIEYTDFLIYPGATVTISSGKNLKASGNFTNRGNLIINSDVTSSGSLLINGTGNGEGTITYNRYVTSSAVSLDGWHLVGSPVLEAENDIIGSGLLLSNGTKQSIATYNNGTSGWDYLLSVNPNNNTISGKGYSIKRDGAGIIPFIGVPKLDDLIDHPITEGAANKWNLVGNPFPSFISINNTATASTENFITKNAAELDPSFVAIYVWNSVSKEYEVVNHTTGAKYLAPGQAFFVLSKDGGGLIDITKQMQTHQSGDLFLRSSNSTPAITLNISDGSITKSTEVKYLENTTTGLDAGYDAGVFSGTSSDFNVYTHLVANSTGVDFALQCLPPSNYENMIVPIGLKGKANTEVTFSINAENLPNNTKIYLEDKVQNTFVRLDEAASEYTITLDVDVNAIGRFYLHTTQSALSVDSNVSQEIIHIYNSENTLHINGLDTNDTKVSLVDLLGKTVLTSSVESTRNKSINLPSSLTGGVYIVVVKTAKSTITKKIILQ